MSPRSVVGWIILLIFVIGYIELFIISGTDGMRNSFAFWQFFLRIFIIGTAIKVFDIVGLDCFLLTKTCFFQHYSPETEGCARWQDFGYNRKQQLRQIIMILIGCVVMALIFTRLG